MFKANNIYCECLSIFSQLTHESSESAYEIDFRHGVLKYCTCTYSLGQPQFPNSKLTFKLIELYKCHIIHCTTGHGYGMNNQKTLISVGDPIFFSHYVH